MIGIILLASALTVDLDAVRMIESSGNPQAYNESSGARGLYQITPICLADWNCIHPKNKYSLDDLWDPKINKQIAAWYLFDRIPQLLDHYGAQISTERILWAHNAGPRKAAAGVMPQETKDYIRKYKEIVNHANKKDA